MAKAGFKDKHKALPLEAVKPGVNYAFTINPSDKYQLFNSFTRLSEIMKESHHYLGQLKRYVLYPELSPKGRFHLHGWIWFNTDKEIIEFYLDYLPQLQRKCSYEMDELNDVSVWTKYCLKQSSFHNIFTVFTYYAVPLQNDFKDGLTETVFKRK